MLVRILTGVIAFVVFLPFLVHSDTMAFPMAMSLCAVISTYEMIRCIGLHKKHYLTIPACLAAAALPVSWRLFPAEGFAICVACALVLMLYVLAITTFSKGKIDITQSATALLVCLYIMAAFTSMVYLRDSYRGEYIYLLVFIGAWVPDTFAYFTGRLFGKHKLIPDVSPKKTVEGAIGGVVFCTLAFVIFGVVYNNLTACDCAVVDGPHHTGGLPLWFMAVAGVLSAVVSMVGDLSMSVIKRRFGIKDYGKMLPGHGGLLDRFDSVLAVAVILAVSFGVASYFGAV